MTLRLSEDRKRLLDDEAPFGIACYEVVEAEPKAGKSMNGRHVGVFGMWEDAESWLETGTPNPTPIYGRETKP